MAPVTSVSGHLSAYPGVSRVDALFKTVAEAGDE